MFDSGHSAKEYLVAQIVSAAERAGVSLSETERAMMYYTETAWTLPDMQEVSDRFDQEYDQAEYEKKIGKLAGVAHAHAKEVGELDKWKEAARTLDREDHYLSVLISTPSTPSNPFLVDRLKLVGTALLICILILIGVALFS